MEFDEEEAGEMDGEATGIRVWVTADQIRLLKPGHLVEDEEEEEEEEEEEVEMRTESHHSRSCFPEPKERD